MRSTRFGSTANGEQRTNRRTALITRTLFAVRLFAVPFTVRYRRSCIKPHSPRKTRPLSSERAIRLRPFAGKGEPHRPPHFIFSGFFRIYIAFP